MAAKKAVQAEAGGLRFTAHPERAASWDGVMLNRDLMRTKRRFDSLPDGDERAEAGVDLLALMMEYVLYITDLTRERILAHLGEYASVDDVARLLSEVMSAASEKN